MVSKQLMRCSEEVERFSDPKRGGEIENIEKNINIMDSMVQLNDLDGSQFKFKLPMFNSVP